MAQIKKRFIADNAVDGSKIQLQNNEAIRVKTSAGGEVELFKLDSSNLFQFISMPQLGSNPVNASDAVRKAYVDTELVSEAALRIAADAAEQAAREAAITAEASARQAADSQLASDLAGEVSARQTAVAAEQAAREAGDAGLQAQIDALDSGSSADIAQEIADRQAADLVLDGKITTEKSRIDAILSASQADKDSFAEIVSLINSVDTENDSAFASYVLSNNAALAQEVSDRQTAVSAEATARSSADATEQAARIAGDSALQSSLSAETAARQAADSAEVSARQAADSAEASARQAADATLQSNIDAKQLDGLANVTITSKVAGQLIQWDAGAGKWVNVSPLSQASTASTSSTTEAIVSSFTNTNDSNDTAGPALGIAYRPTRNMTLSKVGLEIGRNANLTAGMTVTAKVYSVSSTTFSANSVSLNMNNFTPVATSTNTLSGSDLALYPATPQMEYFNFANVALTQDAYYIIWMEVDGVSLTSSTHYLAPKYRFSSPGTYPRGHYKQSKNGQLQGTADLGLGFEVYEGTTVQTSSVQTGVVKTNSGGFIDDSFLKYSVNFGGNKLQGVSTPTADTDAANKKYVDDGVAAEAALRAAADSSEAAARQAADSAEASARQAADSAEASARQAADAALDARLDVVEGSDSTEGSIAKAKKDAKDYADSLNAVEISARQAADASLQSQINSILSNSDPAALDSLAEVVAAFQAADSNLNSAISALGTGSSSALGQEIADRQAADAVLQAAIDAEESRAMGVEAALQASLSQEVSDRQAAVSAEEAARMAADSAEQAAREAADAAEQAARIAAVSAEQAAREAADAAESAARAAELPRHAKVAKTLTASDVSNGYVDLDHVVLPSSTHVFIDRLACHESDDYVLSTVSGKTRVTFSSGLMASEEAPVEGDLFRCGYVYKNGDQPA